MKSTRVGLSEYTAKRLAELRARRAEAEETGSFLTASPSLTTPSTTEYYSASSLLANGSLQQPVSGSDQKFSLLNNSAESAETAYVSDYRTDVKAGLPSDVSQTTFHNVASTLGDSSFIIKPIDSSSFTSPEQPVQLVCQTSAESRIQSVDSVMPMTDDHYGSHSANDDDSLYYYNSANGSGPLTTDSLEFEKINQSDDNGIMSKSMHSCDNMSKALPLASEKSLFASSSELNRHDKSPRPAVAAKPSLKAMGLSGSTSTPRRVSESSSVAVRLLLQICNFCTCSSPVLLINLFLVFVVYLMHYDF
jgi:hypothetical protein